MSELAREAVAQGGATVLPVEAWTGLFGVLVGGLISWWGTWTTTGRQIRAERELRRAERRRADALPVASRLISASDELWAANQAMAQTIFEMVTERQAHDRPDRGEVMQRLGAQRLADIATRRDAKRRALQAAAELAIVSRELEEPADDLIKASEFTPKHPAVNPLPTADQQVAHTRAREVFIQAARRVLVEDPA